MRNRMLVLLGALLPLVGCSTFHETHYFRETNPHTGAPVNYFRIAITGNAFLVRSRYVSGYYDERAVDLFFNELKTATDQDSIPPLFVGSLVNPGSDDKIQPLTPGPEHGAFIMFFSANAKAAADAIGGFADNQSVADGITNLLNRSTTREANLNAATATLVQKKNAATVAELDALFQQLPDPTSTTATDKAAVEATYVRIMNAIARSLGAAAEFTSLDDAMQWANSQPTTTR